MYDARSIANFFLDRADQVGASMTIMTLLKVLYFAHAWYLAKHKEPLVAQPFEAWKYGPVSRVVYDQYKEAGDRPITKRAVSFDPKSLKYLPTLYSFDAETEKFLSNIFDYYSRFHPYQLSHLTHEKGGPWDQVWDEADKRAVPGMIIPNELIATWFCSRNALYWTDREQRDLV
jgi:uncharacterized phage-associated protein